MQELSFTMMRLTRNATKRKAEFLTFVLTDQDHIRYFMSFKLFPEVLHFSTINVHFSSLLVHQTAKRYNYFV